MSELKEWTASEIEEYDDARLELAEDGKIDCTRVYIKQDVDKVIEELEESHKKEVGQLLIEIAELKAQKAQAEDDCAYWEFKAHRERHNKYKRCLTMAMWCKSKSEIYNEFAADASEYMPSYEARFRSKAVLYQKWAMRWLEIAEKFKDKEAK